MAEKVEPKESIDNRTTYRPVRSISLALTPATIQYNKAVETINKLGELNAFNQRMKEYKSTLGVAENALQQNYAKIKEIKDSNILVRAVGYVKVKMLEKQNADLKGKIEGYKNDLQLFESVNLPKEVVATKKQLEKILPDDKLREQVTIEATEKLGLLPETNEKLHEFYAKRETDESLREIDAYNFMNNPHLHDED